MTPGQLTGRLGMQKRKQADGEMWCNVEALTGEAEICTEGVTHSSLGVPYWGSCSLVWRSAQVELRI